MGFLFWLMLSRIYCTDISFGIRIPVVLRVEPYLLDKYSSRTKISTGFCVDAYLSLQLVARLEISALVRIEPYLFDYLAARLEIFSYISDRVKL